MKYDKGHLSFEAQADRLIQRGLIVDKALLINILENVNYYRLSGYLYPTACQTPPLNPALPWTARGGITPLTAGSGLS